MYTKGFLNSKIQKIIRLSPKLNQKFISTGPASEAEMKETAEFYKTLASKYHVSCDLLTLGLHRIWRQALADNIKISEGTKILDAAAGTGLNTLKFLEKSKHLKSRSDFLITMFDINPHMMNVGQANFQRLGYNKNLVNYVEGNLHNLPFAEGSFDTIISSLANRPYVDYGLVLKEMNRVLKSSGKIVILDFCFPENPTILQRLYCNYVQYVTSNIETVILGKDFGVSEFVAKSIRDVVGKTDLHALLKDANFHKLEVKKLTLSIAQLNIAFKK